MGNDDLVEEAGVVGCVMSPVRWVVIQVTYVIAGALGTLIEQAGPSGSPAVQESVPSEIHVPSPTRVETQDPNAGRIVNPALKWIPSRPWER